MEEMDSAAAVGGSTERERGAPASRMPFRLPSRELKSSSQDRAGKDSDEGGKEK